MSAEAFLSWLLRSFATGRRSVLMAAVLLALAVARPGAAHPVTHNTGADWPTLCGDLTQAGFYPRFPQGPLKLSWRKELHRELSGTRCKVIVGGTVLLTTNPAEDFHATLDEHQRRLLAFRQS